MAIKFTHDNPPLFILFYFLAFLLVAFFLYYFEPIYDLYVVDMDYANTLPFARLRSEWISWINKHMGSNHSFGCSVSRTLLPLLGQPPTFQLNNFKLLLLPVYFLSHNAPFYDLHVIDLHHMSTLRFARLRSERFSRIGNYMGGSQLWVPVIQHASWAKHTHFHSLSTFNNGSIMLCKHASAGKRVTLQNNSCCSHLLMEPIYAV